MNRIIRSGLLASIGIVALLGASQKPHLIDALRRGDMASVRAEIQNGANVENPDEYGNTLLMYAAIYGSAADVEYLLSRGANPDAVNKNSYTPLMRAIPDLPKIKLLIEHGAHINSRTADGTTLLMMAAHVRSGSELVKYLVRKGADIEATNNRGLDALMIAGKQGALENLKVLLDAGAKADLETKNVVIRRPNGTEINDAKANTTRRRLEGVTALMAASQTDCGPCARLLLDHGADARIVSLNGLTALHRASYQGNPSTVRMLLDAGAGVNAADNRGLTPLMKAVNSRTKSLEVVQMLLARNADVNAKDASGRTVQDWAAIGANSGIMELVHATPSASGAGEGTNQTATSIHTAREVAVRSIDLLLKTGPGFFPKSGCVSCHNVSIPMLALAEAQHRGYDVKSALSQMAKQTAASLTPSRDDLLSGYCSTPEFSTATSYALLSLHGADYAPDLLTDSVIRCLIVEQFPDGRWSHGGERPPLTPESGIPSTALSARAITLYRIPALAKELDTSLQRARRYLQSAHPRTSDDFAFRLLGLYWTEAPRTEIIAAARQLIAQQRPNGGWSQTSDMSSDAYATGQSLAALAIAQPDLVKSDAYQRGIGYLLRIAEPDGSWHVRSRAFGFQPYFESGFPHGHDQWISMAATSWAAVALMASPE